MKRRVFRLERIKAVDREHAVARVALTRLVEALQADPALLAGEGLKRSDAEKAVGNLEGTYFLRLFAESEAGLRDAWENSFKQTTTPPMRDLLVAVAARRSIPERDLTNAHLVREYRNSLVHEGDDRVEPVPLELAKKYLCTFFSWLPLDW